MKKEKLIDTGLLILRIGLGVIFVAHGMQKIFGIFGGSGIGGFGAMLKGLGFFAPSFWAWIAALTEGVGGLFLLLGVIPRVSAGFIAIEMLVAIITVHAPKGFFLAQGGFEYTFLILMTCVVLILNGGGKFSIFNKL